MKILHISSSDVLGGASQAAYRLHRGLVNHGLSSQMLVQCKSGTDPLVIGSETRFGRFVAKFSYAVDSIPAIICRRGRGATFTPAHFPDQLANRTLKIEPDIVHLHWIAGGFMKIETLARLRRPIVWTLHDMWPFTGGCHYSGECRRFTGSCGCCPALNSRREHDLSRRIWQRKADTWREVPLTVITPSQWMAQCATASSLFSASHVHVIPNGIDTSEFVPVDRYEACKLLGLPHDRHLILFGAMSPDDPRKGFQYLLQAIKELAKDGWGEKAELLVFGAFKSESRADFCMPTHYIGHVGDQKMMRLLYAAADVFIAPSIQDNLPCTIMEALACGTPVVAFDICGMKDMIDHGITGWLAHPFSYQDLANGIVQVVENTKQREEMGRYAREKVVRNFDVNIVTRKHIDIYENLANRMRSNY